MLHVTEITMLQLLLVRLYLGKSRGVIQQYLYCIIIPVLGLVGEHIGSSMQFSRYMFDDKVVVLQEAKPPCHSSINFSWVFPECQIGMVRQHHDWVLCCHQVGSPMFQHLYYCQQLSLIDIVVSFHWREGC